MGTYLLLVRQLIYGYETPFELEVPILNLEVPEVVAVLVEPRTVAPPLVPHRKVLNLQTILNAFPLQLEMAITIFCPDGRFAKGFYEF